MITLHTQLGTNAGLPTAIDCPACGTRSSATPREGVDWVKLAYVVPLLKLRTTSVECNNCHARIACTVPMERLEGAEPAAITPFLRYHPSSLAKGLSIAGLLTCLVPVLGLIVVGIATFTGRGTKGWPAQLNLLSLILSATVTLCTVFVMLGGR